VSRDYEETNKMLKLECLMQYSKLSRPYLKINIYAVYIKKRFIQKNQKRRKIVINSNIINLK
jgi:hypothetical protein